MQRIPQATKSDRTRRTRILVLCAVMVLGAMGLSQATISWAEPSQNGLRQTIATRTPTATPGATCTPTQTVVPGVQRVMLQASEFYAGTKDTWLRSYPPGITELDGGLRVKGGEENATLIQFDLADILPANANVIEADLVFWVDIPSGSGAALDASAFRVLRPWNKTNVDWLSADVAAQIVWTTPGCNGVGTDRVGTADDTIRLQDRAVFRGFRVTDSVRYWAEHPDENNGWLIKGVSASTGLFSFNSSRSSIPERRPLLRIDYTVGDTTPTPTQTGSVTQTPTVTSQPTLVVLTAVDDTYIDEWEPRRNWGSAGYMYVRSSGIRRPLIRFDLGTLPSLEGADVISATMRVPMGQTAPPSPIDVRAYQLRRCWGESAATWGWATSEEPWGMPGAKDPVTDYVDTLLSVTRIALANQTYAWDVTEAARSWIDRDAANCGIMLVGQEGVQTQASFFSSEAGHPAELEILYQVVPPTPTATPTVALRQINVLAYLDQDRDGVRDAGEAGLAAATINLLSDAGAILDQKRTGSDGTCVFSGLMAGWYRVQERPPQGYALSTDSSFRVLTNVAQTNVAFGNYFTTQLALPIVYGD